MELLKLLSANEVVAQIISFLMLLAVLRFFLWKPFLKILDERKARITSDYKKAEDAKLEMEKLKAFYAEQLERIEDIKRVKIQEAVIEGYKETEEIKAEARREAEKIIDAGRLYIQQEFSMVEQRVKDRLVDLTIEAAEMILEQKISDDTDKRLVAEFLEKLESGETGLVKPA